MKRVKQRKPNEKKMTSELKFNDPCSWIATIWDALDKLPLDVNPFDNKEWDEVCTAMGWISDELGVYEDDYGYHLSSESDEDDEN